MKNLYAFTPAPPYISVNVDSIGVEFTVRGSSDTGGLSGSIRLTREQALELAASINQYFNPAPPNLEIPK